MYYSPKPLVALCVAALSACASPFHENGLSHVYVMRHLQAERGEDPPLTDDGQRQAHLLARWFSRHERPRTIFVSPLRRAKQTAEPLAASLGTTVIIYDPADSKALVQKVQATRGSVLVVGHSNTVPDIVELLGGVRPAPIEHSQHGDIWRVSRRNGATDKLSLDDR